MSSKKDYFTVTFYVDDGYVGKDRPLQFEINTNDFDLEDFDTDEEMYDFFWEMVQEEFQNNVHATSDDDTKFVEWVKKLKKSS